MKNRECRNVPRVLFDAVTFLAEALPKRSVPTFLELLFGAMLTQTGFVTDAQLAISALRHWTSYYKWLQHGKWSWVALGLQTARLAMHLFPSGRFFVIIDDTIILRSSHKAPGSALHRQHGRKANRPRFVWGQGWVTVAIAVSKGFRSVAVPVLSRLARRGGNAGKLVAAKTLLEVIAPLFTNHLVCLLMDSWYMRHCLITAALERGFSVIGQVRRDTALFCEPPGRTHKKGRPRKYGEKMTREKVYGLAQTRQQFHLYGRLQTVHYRSALVMAKFLKGRLVRAVWASFENEDGTLAPHRLIITTDTTLSAARVILAYGKRWSIEDLFNQIKNRWGWKDTWQQSRTVLHRWTQIISISYAIPQMLVLLGHQTVDQLANIVPWRAKQPITAGRIRQGLASIFQHVDIRALWNPKSRKFSLPETEDSAQLHTKHRKAA